MTQMFEDSDYKWRHCVVGNIVKDRIYENGVLRHGCKEFRMGTKVYLYGKYFDKDMDDEIDVLGLDRHNRYRVVTIPEEYIENVRYSRVYKPSVLRFMNAWPYTEWWWDDSKEDKQNAMEFVRRWNEGDYLGFEYCLRGLCWILNYRFSDEFRKKLSEDVILRSTVEEKQVEGIDEVMKYLGSFHRRLNDSEKIRSISADDIRFSDGTVEKCIVIDSKIPNDNRYIYIDMDEKQRIKLIWIGYLRSERNEMEGRYYEYSVRENLYKKFGEDPFTEMKKNEPDISEETRGLDMEAYRWAKAYLGTLGLFIRNTNRFLLDTVLKDDYIALIAEEDEKKTAYLLFMLVSGRDTFSPEQAYLEKLIEEWNTCGYDVKFVIDIISSGKNARGGIELSEKTCPVVPGSINGKNCLRYEYSTYWDNCFARLQYVLKNGDRSAYECVFDENVRVCSGEKRDKALLGSGIDYLIRFLSRFQTVTVGYVKDRATGAYNSSVFADDKELSLNVGRNNLITGIRVNDRKDEYVPEECTFELCHPISRIPDLSEVKVLDSVKMHGYVLQLRYGDELRNYYIGWFKGFRSPDDIETDGFLFTPENIERFVLTDNGDLKFENGYIIPKHILYYRSCRQLEIEKTGYYKTGLYIAGSDTFEIRSLYRTPLLQFCGWGYFDQHWDSKGEWFGPAKALIDDEGNRVSPIEVFGISEESLNEDCLDVCVYPSAKYGILKKDGTWLFPPIYEQIRYSKEIYSIKEYGDYSEPKVRCAQGRRIVDAEEKTFLLTAEGKEIAFGYDFNVQKFNSGLCPFSVREEKSCPHEGYYYYEDYDFEPGLWGFFNKKGEIVIEPKYTLQFGFWNAGGKRCVVAKLTDGELKWGLIDLEGNEVIPCTYAELYCRWGEAITFKREKGGLYGLMDLDGNVIIEPQFSFIEAYNKDHRLITAGEDDDHLGVFSVDLDRFILQGIYDCIDYEEGYIECELSYSAEYEYYSYDGKRIKTPENAKYHHEPECRNGLRTVEEGRLCGLETVSGERILDAKYERMYFKNDMVLARESNGSGWSIRDVLVDYNGEILVQGKYRNMIFSKDERYITVETPKGMEKWKVIRKTQDE